MQTQSFGIFVAGAAVSLLFMHTFPILRLFGYMFTKDLSEEKENEEMNAESDRDGSDTVYSPLRRTRAVQRNRPQTARSQRSLRSYIND
jgi:hypothetical protein